MERRRLQIGIRSPSDGVGQAIDVHRPDEFGAVLAQQDGERAVRLSARLCPSTTGIGAVRLPPPSECRLTSLASMAPKAAMSRFAMR